MENKQVLEFIGDVVENMPNDWVKLTTHRLDIYTESLAKTEFLDRFELLYNENNATPQALAQLPTAFDYIRLGHPLSCVLEWTIAQLHEIPAERVISFSSKTAPLLAILRKNSFEGKNTLIAYREALPSHFQATVIRDIYGYNFELQQVSSPTEIKSFDGSIIYYTAEATICQFDIHSTVDFHINAHDEVGSIILVNGEKNVKYISEIQHVRRRETIAMTPNNTKIALQSLLGEQESETALASLSDNKAIVAKNISRITTAPSTALVASSGLSMQYAIVMGLIEDALTNHPGKDIKIIVPPNCYGGTNDQARRVAACIPLVEVMDLPVDGKHNMVQSIDVVLEQIAKQDAIPLIIAEVPTNPRVEVPNMNDLERALGKKRVTAQGTQAIAPVFILDQTFCPNVHFLGSDNILKSIQTIAYVSGSKFPSGGLCTAGYCVSNQQAMHLIAIIEKHLLLCDNEATALQYAYLAQQLPSMLDRISSAYTNTREFVETIQNELPEAKINFVSEELAAQGFTPSVFSLDLPTYGSTDEEREENKRALNLKLINMMIETIPTESKYCVSYGQLKGCYWTIPATSTQGTTKEGDKDYIVRVALSAHMDLEKHKEVFHEFVTNSLSKVLNKLDY